MHSHTVQGVNLNSRWMETTPESEHWLIVIIIMMKNVHRPLAGARSVFLCGDRRRSNDRGREEQSKVRDPWQRMGGCNLRWSPGKLPGPAQRASQAKDDDSLVLLGRLQGEEEGDREGDDDRQEGEQLQDPRETFQGWGWQQWRWECQGWQRGEQKIERPASAGSGSGGLFAIFSSPDPQCVQSQNPCSGHETSNWIYPGWLAIVSGWITLVGWLCSCCNAASTTASTPTQPPPP